MKLKNWFRSVAVPCCLTIALGLSWTIHFSGVSALLFGEYEYPQE